MNGPNNPIGWCDYTWNPVTGCEHRCRFRKSRDSRTTVTCYAEALAERFRGTKAWPLGFQPMLRSERLTEPTALEKPARIFSVSMGDLFGSWVPDEWIRRVLDACRAAPQHTFVLLTKAPWNAKRWKMPDNVWLGATVTGGLDNEKARLEAVHDFQAGVRFLSCEPLEGLVDPTIARPDWIILGAATGAGAFQPDERWVRDIEAYAAGSSVPIYHKSNLTLRPQHRHERPK